MDDNLSLIGGILVVLLVAVAITTCGHDYLTATPVAIEVTVVDKSYTPGHYDTTCTTDGHGHHSCDTDWVAPVWSVQYEDGAQRFRTTVSSGTYETLHLGDRRVLQYQRGGGLWQARYRERFVLQSQTPESGWPVR